MADRPFPHDPDFWSTASALAKVSDIRLCLAESSSQPCSGSIIAAHTIPRSQLRKIAIDGHVYAFQGNLPTFARTDGEIELRKFGIGQFSVLNCFCEFHDRELFAPVETSLITGTPLQVATLNYRGAGSELYRKLRSQSTFSHAAKTIPKIKNSPKRREFAKLFLQGTQLGLNDIASHFADCERSIYGPDLDSISALVIQFDQQPSIMSVGGFAPEYDFDGNRLQDFSEEEAKWEHITLSILSNDQGAIVVLSWLKKETAPLRLAQSLAKQDRQLLTTLLIQLVFEHLENTCMNIHWWDGLKEVERRILTNRMQVAVASLERQRANAMTFGGVRFDDWDYKHHFFLNI